MAGPLPLGKTVELINESVLSSGSTVKYLNIDSETVSVGVVCGSISGTLDISVDTIADGQVKNIITFTQISAPTANIVIETGTVSLDRIRVTATYSAACEYSVRVKGVNLSGSATISGTVDTDNSIDNVGVYGSINITSSASEAKVGASALSDRRQVSVQPVDGDIWYGYNSSVTSSTGTKLFRSQLLILDYKAGTTLYLVADSGTVEVRVTEV